MTGTLAVLDLSALCYRAYYAAVREGPRDPAAPWLAGRVLGLAAEVLARSGATHAVFALDDREGTFRHRLHPAYKAGRARPGADFAPQLARTVEALRRGGWALLAARGFEADDVAAAVVRQAGAFARVVVATTDRDLLALASGRVRLLWYVPTHPAPLDLGPADAVRVFGVEPARIAHVKAIAGDASDNFAGCPGIGATGAAALVRAHGSVAGVYAALERLPDRQRELLAAHRAQVELCLVLATLRPDAPAVLDPAAARLPAAGVPRAA